ncbi:hypothetical protein [Psychromicrobium xiongbiense]|uniref:hypothetical protein n=1 Tax=Psychromicrobium xiongbiense TaxID=3051184 RepID=UPI002553B78E|nr:hypothetical protein [Psychromicrobium sp. YIM S02556]
MIQSPQTIQIARNGILSDATIAWGFEGTRWRVEITSTASGSVEALCLVREKLEQLGWRIGVAGAERDVRPSGMARDQGGGLIAYRIAPGDQESTVDTFAPVDPATVVTVAEQRVNVSTPPN